MPLRRGDDFEILVGPGYHPFASRYAGNGNALPIPELIRQGIWPHASKKHPDYLPPTAAPFDLLHPLVQPLMTRCFEAGHFNPADRPLPIDWLAALRAVRQDTDFIQITAPHREAQAQAAHCRIVYAAQNKKQPLTPRRRSRFIARLRRLPLPSRRIVLAIAAACVCFATGYPSRRIHSGCASCRPACKSRIREVPRIGQIAEPARPKKNPPFIASIQCHAEHPSPNSPLSSGNGNPPNAGIRQEEVGGLLGERRCQMRARMHLLLQWRGPAMPQGISRPTESPFKNGYAIVDPDIPEKVAAESKRIRKRGLVQLCTTVDVWCPVAQQLPPWRRRLEALLSEPGWTVRILTKTRRRRDFDLVEKHHDRVLVGLSLTGNADKDKVLAVVNRTPRLFRSVCRCCERPATVGFAPLACCAPLPPGHCTYPGANRGTGWPSSTSAASRNIGPSGQSAVPRLSRPPKNCCGSWGFLPRRPR